MNTLLGQILLCINVMKTNLIHYLSSVCWPTEQQVPIVLYIYIYIYSLPPDDGLQICPKHVEVDWHNKLRINSASSWFSLYRLDLHVYIMTIYTV